ncbi:hypothetical protein AI2795V1_4693 (plasmid) [Serratia marcescens]|jgi:hypothetical protein|uniref:hypothetical protein n=1 Tax=Serratia marcescens TaxID=615 RepID=UPI001DC743D4|nr:hypothetical protein [Serratia marcescens]CAE7797804.1 hypothetical protein AI2795V1_4693 [Serratia marcescens]CAH3928793.1 hypothetical protein AI2795V1_4693 [Serratia marcescens]
MEYGEFRKLATKIARKLTRAQQFAQYQKIIKKHPEFCDEQRFRLATLAGEIIEAEGVIDPAEHSPL